MWHDLLTKLYIMSAMNIKLAGTTNEKHSSAASLHKSNAQNTFAKQLTLY
jgi:hypothetical protein